MSIVYIGIGFASGVALSYFLKNNNNSKNSESDKDYIESLNNKNKILQEELSVATNTIDTLKVENKRLLKLNDKIDDNKEDADYEINKLKKTNLSLVAEVEKLKAELNEFEMLYNARKQEINDLKKIIENGN